MSVRCLLPQAQLAFRLSNYTLDPVTWAGWRFDWSFETDYKVANTAPSGKARLTAMQLEDLMHVKRL
jgi:hypothetical protein